MNHLNARVAAFAVVWATMAWCAEPAPTPAPVPTPGATPDATPAPDVAAPKPGLHLIHATSGEDEYLGPYYNPSVDPANKLVYADDGRGSLWRWSLDDLTADPVCFAAPPPQEPGYRFPVAAPAGGLVAAFQAWRPDLPTARKRVAVSFLRPDGKRIAGGLPLFFTDGRYNGALSIAWKPGGELVAFYLTVGVDTPGLYVFRPSDKYWVRGGGTPATYGQPQGRLQWQPDGRSLSEATPGHLVLRGGANFVPYGKIDTAATLHTWLDGETLLLHDPDRGLVEVDISGAVKGTIGGWPGPLGGDGNATLAVVQGRRLAWIRALATDGAGRVDYGLYVAVLGAAAGNDVFRFTAHTGYAWGNAGPVWLPDKDALLVSVPPAPPPAPVSPTTPTPPLPH
jgi:hypothetical protein